MASASTFLQPDKKEDRNRFTSKRAERVKMAVDVQNDDPHHLAFVRRLSVLRREWGR